MIFSFLFGPLERERDLQFQHWIGRLRIVHHPHTVLAVDASDDLLDTIHHSWYVEGIIVKQ